MNDAQIASLIRPDGFLLSRDARALGVERLVETVRRRGDMVQIRVGVYMSASRWSALTPNSAYATRVRAAALVLRKDAVFSHHSAAVIWDLPIIGPWPTSIHTITHGDGGGRSAPGITRHTTAARFATVARSGLAVTTASRTVLDLATTAPLPSALAVADRALRLNLTTKASLEEELRRARSARGVRQARFVIGFADGDAANGGESLLRLRLHTAGFPPPVLQHAFFDADGRIGDVDAFWPEYDVVLEFDGKQKYLREEFLQGRTASEVVIAEKIREDRLRAVVSRVVRVVWSDLDDPARLARILESAGVPRHPTNASTMMRFS